MYFINLFNKSIKPVDKQHEKQLISRKIELQIKINKFSE